MAGTPKTQTSKDSQTQPAQARLRDDLKTVFDRDASGKAAVTVLDPVSGKQFSFSEAEFFLCQKAGPDHDLAAICAAYKAKFKTEMTEAEVAGLYRRLRILGLLAAPDAPKDETDKQDKRRARLDKIAGARSPKPEAPARTREVAPPADPQPMSSKARDAAAASLNKTRKARQTATTPTPVKPAPVKTASTAKTPTVSAPVTPTPVADETPKPSATPSARPRPTLPRSKPAQDSQTDRMARLKAMRARADNATSTPPAPKAAPTPAQKASDATIQRADSIRRRPEAPEPKPAQAAAPEPEAAKPAQSDTAQVAPKPTQPASPGSKQRVENIRNGASTHPTPKPEVSEPEKAEKTPPPKPVKSKPTQPASPDTKRRADNIRAGATSRPAPQPTDNLRAEISDPFGLPDEDDDDLGFDGGGGGDLRQRLKARRGGMGGGGFGDERGGGFGGGMGGGGMGGGGGAGNRDRIMAALAQNRGAGAGGGGGDRFGMQGTASAPEGGRKAAASLGLFNPTALFKLFYVLFYPAKFFLWLLLPAVLLAGLTIFQRWPAFASDLVGTLEGYLVITRVLIGALTVNLVSRLAQGTAIVAVGGQVQDFGIKLLFGLIPRFYVDTAGVRSLDRAGQLAVYGAPLLARLGLFAFGVIFWATFRSSGGALPGLALLISQMALIVFLVTSFPLIPADGMRWLAAYFGENRMVEKTFLVVKNRMTGQPNPPGLDAADAKALLFFGISVLLCLAGFILTLAAYFAIALEDQFGGLGVMLFLGMVVAFVMWLIAVRVAGGKTAAAARENRPDQGFMAEALAEPGRLTPAPVADPSSLMGKARVVWIVIGVGLLAVAFLPYSYEAGGQVEILPQERSHAVARTNGEIVEIAVDEGDYVQTGQLVARLSSWKQESDVSVTEILLQKERAQLAKLNAGAKAEEIGLAQSRVASAEAEVAFAQSEADRAQQLVDRGAVSVRELERANSNLETTLADLEVARAELELVQSGATQEEVLIAEAEVQRLEYDLGYKQAELERTRIYAPIPGQVVTPNLELMHGQYLEVGDVFVEIENDDLVSAEIAVPEADIALIAVGDQVRLKTYGGAQDTVIGQVTLVAPNAEAREFGRIVRVEAVFPNPDGQLRSAMTGYAKVDGEDMRVWQAFLRRIVRFYQVDVWSWIP